MLSQSIGVDKKKTNLRELEGDQHEIISDTDSVGILSNSDSIGSDSSSDCSDSSCQDARIMDEFDIDNPHFTKNQEKQLAREEKIRMR